jgi:hypothetical protein
MHRVPAHQSYKDLMHWLAARQRSAHCRPLMELRHPTESDECYHSHM